jgi:hypothetical protein
MMSVNRRAFSREGGQAVIDLRLAYIADGANGCSLRADRPVAGGSLSEYAVNYLIDFNEVE